MSAGTVVLVRHGQTQWNAHRRLQGQADVELDEVGIGQAAHAASALAAMRPAAIVSSDLVRAARTADAVAGVVGLEIGIDPRLRERAFGSWEGLDHGEIEGGWPAEYALWSGGGQPDGIGLEPRGDVGRRVAAAVVEHAQHLEHDQALLVITHGAAISAGIAALLGQDAGSWNGVSGLGNCHWSVLHPTRSGHPAWRLSAHNVAPPA